MSYEVTLTVSDVKDEHVPYVTRLAATCAQLFRLDGSDVQTNVSVERNRDGVERVYEYLVFEDDDWRAPRRDRSDEQEEE